MAASRRRRSVPAAAIRSLGANVRRAEARRSTNLPHWVDKGLHHPMRRLIARSHGTWARRFTRTARPECFLRRVLATYGSRLPVRPPVETKPMASKLDNNVHGL